MDDQRPRDDLPDEARLDRIERAVMRRVRDEDDGRRRRVVGLRRGGIGLALVAAAVGLAVITHPAGQLGAASSGGSGGDSAGSAASGSSAALVVVCHRGATASAPAAKTKVPGDASRARIGEACRRALTPAPATGASSTPTTADVRGPVVCRDDGGALEVFLTERPAKTVCAANGLTPG